jgi:hypothetical protein
MKPNLGNDTVVLCSDVVWKLKKNDLQKFFRSDSDRTYAAGGETVNYVALQWDYTLSSHSYVLNLAYKLFIEPSLG